MQLPTLEFEQDDSRAGYRLQRLEVLNWGTFDKRIWTIDPSHGGNDTITTGADTAAAAAPADPPGGSAEPRLPSQLLVVQLVEGAQLVPEAEYVVRVTGIRNVVGLTGDAEGSFTAPQPPEVPQEAGPGALPDTVPTPEPVPEP